ncbi:MAG TPA: ImmA/IrrE family metallo-endopeptidase [Candidatus Acidoferrum sp.]|nr:ImmA/IrrE family metallo-endopeptidase [Candidatus Acidoferrum sp.]
MKSKTNPYMVRISSLVGEANQNLAVRDFVQSHRQQGESLESVATRLGIAEIKYEPLPFDGGIFEDGATRVIKINSFRPEVRRNFTLAHELAHLIMAASFEEKKRKPCPDDPNLERTCDSIAAELLMPYEETVRLATQLGRQSPEKLGTLAKKFGVSLETAARRLHTELGLWKLPMGLWECGPVARELWFVGKRPWRSPRQSFSAFELARESRIPIVTRERYPRGTHTELVDLKVLHIGNNKILGVIAI